MSLYHCVLLEHRRFAGDLKEAGGEIIGYLISWHFDAHTGPRRGISSHILSDCG